MKVTKSHERRPNMPKKEKLQDPKKKKKKKKKQAMRSKNE